MAAPGKQRWRIWLPRVLAALRIFVGLYFGKEALTKISAGWLVGGSNFTRTIRGYPAAHDQSLYHDFVARAILPHATVFALLVTLGECAVALSLILGLITRAGALTALWLNLNFMLLRGIANPSGTLDKGFLIAEILFLVYAAGRRWGLDGLLADRLAAIPLLRWLSGASSSTCCGSDRP